MQNSKTVIKMAVNLKILIIAHLNFLNGVHVWVMDFLINFSFKNMPFLRSSSKMSTLNVYRDLQQFEIRISIL